MKTLVVFVALLGVALCADLRRQRRFLPTASGSGSGYWPLPPFPTDGSGGIVHEGSCEDKCGGHGEGFCWCDSICDELGDCCPDKYDHCTGDDGSGSGEPDTQTMSILPVKPPKKPTKVAKVPKANGV